MARSLFNLRVKGDIAEAIFSFISQTKKGVLYSDILARIGINELRCKGRGCEEKYTLQEAIENNFSCVSCGGVVQEFRAGEALAFLEQISLIQKQKYENNPKFVLKHKTRYPFRLFVLKKINEIGKEAYHEEPDDVAFQHNLQYKKVLAICLKHNGKVFHDPRDFASFLNTVIRTPLVIMNKNKAENWLLLFTYLGVISRVGKDYMINFNPDLMTTMLLIYVEETGSDRRIKLEAFFKFLQRFLPIEDYPPNAILGVLQILNRSRKITLATRPDDISKKYLLDNGRYVREAIIN